MAETDQDLEALKQAFDNNHRIHLIDQALQNGRNWTTIGPAMNKTPANASNWYRNNGGQLQAPSGRPPNTRPNN